MAHIEFTKIQATEKPRKSELQKTKELKEKYKLGTLNELCSLKAGQAFNWLYRLDTNATFDDKVYSNARNWWERADAIQQCKNTIGDKKPTEKCYICGLKLNEDKDTAECEHILPVFQGALFLNLYRSEYKDVMDKVKKKQPLTKKEEDLHETLMMEYKWAHKCCNQIKSNISFLTFDPKRDKFTIDFNSTAKILTGIFEAKMQNKEGKYETRGYCESLSRKLKAIHRDDLKKFIQERSDAINFDNIQPICNKINKLYNIDNRKGLFYLSILSNLITAADSSLIDAAQAAARGAELNKPPPMESIEKAQIYADISSKISHSINSYNWTTRDKGTVNDILSKIVDVDPTKTSLLNSKNKPDVDKINRFLIESIMNGLNTTTMVSAMIRYDSLYRDLFCIFGLKPHSNAPMLIHNEGDKPNYKMAAQLANYGTHIVLLSILLNKLSMILQNYRNSIRSSNTDTILNKKYDNVENGIITVYNYINALLIENINYIKPIPNHSIIFCCLIEVISIFGVDIQRKFIDNLGKPDFDSAILHLETVKMNYANNDNVLHGRVKYYDYFSDSLKDIDVEDIRNIDLIEVNAVHILSELNKLKSIFTEDTTERREIVKQFNDARHDYELEVSSQRSSTTNESKETDKGKTRKRSISMSTTESMDSVSSLENKQPIKQPKRGGKKQIKQNKTQRGNRKI